MKAATVVGIILIILGLVALVVRGIEYTTNETVIDAGPLEVEAEQRKTLPLGPVAGGVAVVAGLILVGIGRRG